ncbi:hypothetical protein PENSPDRAFT_669731 [Peniophora sp. CONT]|nr:hypothetical protein PENSPDRAFT_669731 [Peniophora sp. CONT]
MPSDAPTVNAPTGFAENLIPPLDPDLFRPSPEALPFLKKTISHDEEEIRARVQDVQKDAKFPYPCFRGFHHVALFMSSNAAYQRVLELGRTDPEAVLLDIGCCMGTDVRKATYDGYPASQIVGCELIPEFLALGHKLYADEGTCPIRFIQCDVFALDLPSPIQPVKLPPTTSIAQVASLNDLIGRVAAIYTGALFHLFDESSQLALALRLAILIRSDKPSIIFGRHQGLPQAGLMEDKFMKSRYAHSPESWIALWKQVFGTVRGEEFAREKVVVKAELALSDMASTRQAINFAMRSNFLYWSVEISS